MYFFIVFFLIYQFIISLFYRSLIILIRIDHTLIEFPTKKYSTLPQNKKAKNKKDEKLSSLKRLLKIPIPGYFPANLFPTFKVTLKVTLNLLKTSLAAIILLFFRSNQR